MRIGGDRLEAVVQRGVRGREAASRADEVWAGLRPVTLRDRTLAGNRIVTRRKDASLSGPFDMLRTRLLRILQANGWRSVLVTSPTSGCGKTTLSLNLGFSLARSQERRVMLVELDLIRPHMAQMLGVRPETGVGEMLRGTATPGETFLRCDDNLAVALAAGRERHSAEVLESALCGAALLNATATLAPDVVLYDLPPVLAADDTLAFAAKADCALVIAAEGVSRLEEIDASVEQLSRSVEVIGVVLNKSIFPASSYYGSYAY